MNEKSTQLNKTVEDVNVEVEAEVQRWAKKFDVSPEQIQEAVGEVGQRAADVEMYLKGTRSTTNADQEAAADVTDKQE